jgi:TonB family protein
MRALLCIALVACWSSSTTPPPAEPRTTTSAAATQPTTAVPASAPVEDVPVDDVDSGDETVLNAKRWQFASYWNRVKRSIAAQWDPIAVWNAFPAPVRTSYGTGTRKTIVAITLDAKGAVKRIDIVQPSGIVELDAAALQSVPGQLDPPPAELVAQQAKAAAPGVMTFQFGFYFEVGAQHATTKLGTKLVH